MKKNACKFITYTIHREDIILAECFINGMRELALEVWEDEEARFGILAARLRMIDMVREWKEKFFFPHVKCITYGTSRPTEKLFLRYKLQGKA